MARDLNIFNHLLYAEDIAMKSEVGVQIFLSRYRAARVPTFYSDGTIQP